MSKSNVRGFVSDDLQKHMRDNGYEHYGQFIVCDKEPTEEALEDIRELLADVAVETAKRVMKVIVEPVTENGETIWRVWYRMFLYTGEDERGKPIERSEDVLDGTSNT